MNIEKSTVTKLLITGIEDLDPIHVFIDDMNANRGRVTVTCFDESWSYFWGSIGNKTIAQFFCGCSNDYLARKLSTGIESTVVDVAAIEKHARAYVCERRKDCDIEKDEARELFNQIDGNNFDDPNSEHELLYEIYGDEWWHGLPQKINPAYEYLCRIISAVKQALSQEMVAA